jgi:hypothetical protein
MYQALFLADFVHLDPATTSERLCKDEKGNKIHVLQALNVGPYA